MSLEDRINTILDALGINVPELARRLDISHSVIYEVRKGTRPLSKRLRYSLIDRLGVNPDYLDRGENPVFLDPENRPGTSYSISKRQVFYITTELASAFWKLKKEGSIDEDQFHLLQRVVLATLKEMCFKEQP